MKRFIAMVSVLLIFIQVCAAQQRLKKGQEFTYQTSTYDFDSHNQDKESLKRYKTHYKVLKVRKDAYDMEARFELMDEYLRQKDRAEGAWRNVRLVYPELDVESYHYLYQNTLFKQDKILFKLPKSGKPSDVKLIGRRVGLDPLMDKVISDKFISTFFSPVLPLPSHIKVNDTVQMKPPYFGCKVIKKNADYIVLEGKELRARLSIRGSFKKGSAKKSWLQHSLFVKEPHDKEREEELKKIVEGETDQKYSKGESVYDKENNVYGKNRFVVDAKTGVLIEVIRVKVQGQEKRSDRTVLISNPAIRLKGKLEQNAVGDTLSLVYKTKYQLKNEEDTLSAIISKDNTFEFALPFGDLQQVRFDTQNPIRFYVQPGDDLFITMDSIKGSIVDVEGIGSESLRFLLHKESQLKTYQPDDILASTSDIVAHKGSYLEQTAQYLTKECGFILSHFNELTPEVYLAEYWKNQLTANMIYGGIEKINNHIERKSKVAGQLLDVQLEEPKIDLMRSDCFCAIHWNNELMRFANLNVSFYFYENYFHVGDNLKAATGLSKSVGRYKKDKESLDHYNTVENFFEGYTAFYLKYRLVLAALYDNSREVYNNLYNRFKTEYKNHESLAMLSEVYEKVERVRPGTKAPSFALADMEGNTVRLKDFLGKAVFIDFYANRSRYHIHDVDRLSSNLKEFTDNHNVVFILIYVEKGSTQDRLRFEALEFDGVKLIAPEQQANELSQLYSSPNMAHQAVVDVGGRILTRIPPTIDWIYTRPNLMYDALVAQPKIMDDEATIRKLRVALMFLGGFILVGLLAWLMYRRRARHKIKTTELNARVRALELTAIRAQMNPHFMYNCLNSIQNLVQKKLNDEAHRYLSKFAELIRSVLKNSEKEEVSLSTELDMISNYVELEKLRFDIDFEIGLDKKIDADFIFIPPLIIQPLVENAILHGLSPKQGERKLTIDIKADGEGAICVSIADNGVGRYYAEASSTASNGKGLKFSQERLDLLADKYGTSYQMRIVDLKDKQGQAKGTQVKICFPEE